MTRSAITRILAGALLLGGCGSLGGDDPSDGSAPQIRIDAPADMAIVHGTVNIDVTALDDFGVDRVRVLIDNVELAVMFTPPFRATWNTNLLTDNSSHTIRAEAKDVANNSSFAQITVTVVNGTNAPPARAP